MASGALPNIPELGSNAAEGGGHGTGTEDSSLRVHPAPIAPSAGSRKSGDTIRKQTLNKMILASAHSIKFLRLSTDKSRIAKILAEDKYIRAGVVTTLIIMCFFGGIGHLCFLALFAYLREYGLVVFNICSSSYFFICFGTLLHITRPRTKTRHSTIATAAEIVIWTSMVEIAAHASVATAQLGWGWGFQNYLFVGLGPFIQLRLRATRGSQRSLGRMLLWSAGSVGLALAFFFSLFFYTHSTSFTPSQSGHSKLQGLAAAMNSTFVIIISICVLLRVEHTLAAELQRTRRRMDTLESVRSGLERRSGNGAGGQSGSSNGNGSNGSAFVLDAFEKRFGSFHPDDWLPPTGMVPQQ